MCLVAYAISRRGQRCPDCDSEAMEIELVSRKGLLGRVTLEQWLDSRERWVRDAKSFLPEYHAARLARLDALIELKKSMPVAAGKSG